MEKAAKSEGLAERGSRWLRNIHLGIGAIALVGAAVVAPAYEAFLTAVAIFEGAHATLWEGIRRIARGRKSPKASPAPA